MGYRPVRQPGMPNEMNPDGVSAFSLFLSTGLIRGPHRLLVGLHAECQVLRRARERQSNVWEKDVAQPLSFPATPTTSLSESELVLREGWYGIESVDVGDPLNTEIGGGCESSARRWPNTSGAGAGRKRPRRRRGCSEEASCGITRRGT